jgi:hypothetical protein
MIYLKAFVAGFASTLVFHQGLLWLLHAGGFSPRAPWNMTLLNGGWGLGVALLMRLLNPVILA